MRPCSLALATEAHRRVCVAMHGARLHACMQYDDGRAYMPDDYRQPVIVVRPAHLQTITMSYEETLGNVFAMPLMMKGLS